VLAIDAKSTPRILTIYKRNANTYRLRWNTSNKTLAFFAVYLAKKASGVYGRNSTGRFE